MKLFSKIKRLTGVLKGHFRMNPEEGLQGRALDEVLVGSLYSFGQGAFLNSYSTGLTKEELQVQVHKLWNIRDREGALEILLNLLKRNQSKNLKVIYEAYEYEDFADYLKFRLHENNEDAVREYIAYLDKLHEVVPKLTSEHIIANYEAVKRYQDSGWNLGRGAFLARCCYELNYIDLTELKELLSRFYQQLQEHCKSWKEYTASYILGRSLEERPKNKRLIILAEKLLQDEKSPLKERVLNYPRKKHTGIKK